MKIWARIGITVDITKEQYKRLERRASYKNDKIASFGECTLTQDEAKYFIKNGVADGDSYIPEKIFMDINKQKENERS